MKTDRPSRRSRFPPGEGAARAALAAALLAAAVACEKEAEPPAPPASAPVAPPATAEPTAPEDTLFVERTDTGVDFRHRRFQNPEKKYLPETAGSGVALLDHDGDGDLDLYFVQGCPLPGSPTEGAPAPNRLFRNDGGWKFTDVTAEAGVGDLGYGMGASAPDLDNDGFPELYVTNVRANVLYHNRGDGTFEDVTERSGLGDAEWSTAVAWFDMDRDGDLDLYLANYALCDFENYTVCSMGAKGQRLVSYCHPDTFTASPDRLFRNDGDFRFVDVTAAAGIVDTTGKGLAVVPFDANDDGFPDLFVANDSNENFLWINQGDGRFAEEADFYGVSVGGKGGSQACMGTDIGDIDGDGDFDIFSANFGKEPNVLYVRDGDFFEDEIYPRGLGEVSYLLTGFGADFFDHDRDGDLDLMVLNGHIVDVIEHLDPSQTFEQLPNFFENRGDGTFVEIGAKLGPYFRRQDIGRGLAVGDLDDDGDLDVVCSHNDHPAVLLENRYPGENRWIGISLVGTRSPRDAIGTRVTLHCGAKTLVEEVRGSTSYLSWLDLRLFFGLGSAPGPCSAEIRWSSGQVQQVGELAAGRYHSIEEPR